MTHDELLEKVNEELKSAEFDAECNNGGQEEAVKALRAVVELHKPVMEEYSRSTNGAILFAERCSCGRSYPCPTIQAIEKELK